MMRRAFDFGAALSCSFTVCWIFDLVLPGTEDLIFFRVLSHTCPMYWIFTPMFFQTVVYWFFVGMMRKETLHPPMFPCSFTQPTCLCSAPVLDRAPVPVISHNHVLDVFFHTSSTACIESLAEQEVQPSIRWFYSFIPHNSSYLVCFDPRPIE